ncbi:hypothetical protein E2C01_041574 [Portunus trituberculatus]|uniref:Uncharacterized protein n=1 Tax=Portunus trituberculatus TaxID=210409 RepID=A0A5B7FQR0_PORTR|nr:hypothetical protein [Portunus trituberculatus]
MPAITCILGGVEAAAEQCIMRHIPAKISAQGRGKAGEPLVIPVGVGERKRKAEAVVVSEAARDLGVYRTSRVNTGQRQE